MLDGHDAPVTAVAVGTLASREVVVTGDRAGAVRWWDADTGELVDRAYEDATGPIQGVCAGTAGDLPLIGALDDDGRLTVWDADTTVEAPGLFSRRPADHGPFLLRYCDRDVLVVADHQRVYAVDAGTGRNEVIGDVCARIGRPPRYEDATDGHDGGMSVFAIGPVGGSPWWVTGDIWGYHYVWQGAVRGELVGRPVVESTALAIGSAGGQALIVRAGTDLGVRVHDLAGSLVAGPLAGCEDRAVAVGLAPDAVLAASGDGTLRRWSAGGWALRTTALPGEPAAMAVSPRTGRAWIAVGSTVVSG
jgi:hypothetical protein